MVEDTGQEQGGNVVYGGAGTVVQAGAVHGGVHVHPRAPSALSGVPQQEPAPPAHLLGRDAELSILDQMWARPSERFKLALISGPAGVGKSALAAQWVAKVKDSFPDGRLYADLGAYDPAGPSHPGEVLSGFLQVLGVPLDQVPARVAEQSSLFRSVTAGKRLLLLLDNALSAAQVRQLLPGGSGSMVVVTARTRLGSLISDGAHMVNLEPLPASAATDLLRVTIGASRVDSDSGAATDLVRRCAGLPIALTVTAARLAARPRWSIRRVVTELAGEGDPLARMSTADGQSVAATFDLSYHALSATAARCYHAIGVHSGRRPGVPVIAAALEVPLGDASVGLDELVDSNLVDDAPDDRFQVHDLILLHAQRRAESDPDRDVLAGRIAEWYLSGTRAADLSLTPYRRRPPDRFTYLSPSAVTFADRDEALEWLERERVNLVAAVVAAAARTPDIAWRISYGMWPLFQFRKHHHDRLTVDRVGVDCARRMGNRDFEARMLRRLAFAHFDLGELAEAGPLFQQSLRLCEELDDRHGIAAALEGLGLVALGDGQYATATELFTRQRAIFEELGSHRRTALAALNLGVVDNAAGRPAQAARHVLRAQEILTSLGDLDPYNTARTHLELGKAWTEIGDHAAAARELDQALHDMRRLGSVRGEAQAHCALALLGMATGRTADARSHLEQARAAYERAGDPDADEVRRLRGLIPPADTDPHRMA